MAAIFINKWIIASVCLIGFSSSQYTSYPNYIGCYHNEYGFGVTENNKGFISVAQCIDTCIRDGGPYALLRGYGTYSYTSSSCYCRSSLETGVSLVEDSLCTKRCPTNTHVTCGNTEADYSSVYHIECQPGYWSRSTPVCSNQCHCRDNRPCDITTGHCPSGLCASGWKSATPGQAPEICDQSCYGSFGENCAQQCYCLTSSCNPGTGICYTPGCQAGYRGDSCSQTCYTDSFGENCAEQCHCQEGTCRHVDGRCETPGCQAGYTGDSCSQSCFSGSFGQDCVQQCHCLVDTCDPVTGICTTPGCQAGYTGDTCSTETITSKPILGESPSTPAVAVNQERPSDGSSSLQTGRIAGGVVGAVAVVAIAVFLIIFFHRRKQKKSKTDNIRDEEQGRRIAPTISTDVGKAPNLPKRKVLQAKAEFEEETGDEEEEERMTEEAEYMNILRTKPLLLTDLLGVVTGARQEKLPFKDEYESIPKSKMSSWEVAADDNLKSKNRFKDILPYDNSRVILNVLHDDPLTSYINASFIQNYGNSTTFIAAQGPSKDTVVDFWRMIWEQNICLVVMLTGLVESGKRKCDKYWPEQGTGNYRGLKVTMEQAQVLPNFTRRELNIKQDGVSRRVIQHHFTSWPDHGVPEYATPLLNFHKKVMAEVDSQEEGHPVLVHCSAGVGRTGVFLAIDYLLHQAREEGHVDIPKTVHLLREKRVKMVQTRAQYAFLYSSILQAVTVGDTLIPCYQFPSTYNQMNQLDPQTPSTKLQEQFKLLEIFKSTEHSDSYSAANKPENQEKNRFQDILPTDSAYASLMTPVKGRTDYINAVFVDGRSNKQGYIATQMPLADTVVDFWCLVVDYSCTCIVMLNKGNSDEEKLGIYWPEADNSVTHGPFTVTLEDEEEEEDLIIRHLKLTGTKKKHTRTVFQFCYQGWPENDTSSTVPFRALFLLHEKVQKFHETPKSKGPIIVHDIDGVGRCGVYIALCNLVDMMRLEQELDVFHVVETIRTYRPQFITSQEQYQGLYEGAKEYMDTFSTYSNFQ